MSIRDWSKIPVHPHISSRGMGPVGWASENARTSRLSDLLVAQVEQMHSMAFLFYQEGLLEASMLRTFLVYVRDTATKILSDLDSKEAL